MGIPGAGKSRMAETYAARGYVRLNRDERGGSLLDLAGALEEEVSAGTRRVVLDNTYLSRATRSYVIDAAARHGFSARCIWLDTPLAQAQVNLVERLVDQLGSLPTPGDGALRPTSQMRALRELEQPSTDEGWVEVERIPFTRSPAVPTLGTGVFVAATALAEPGWREAVASGAPDAPHLVFDWRPEGAAADLAHLAARIDGPVDTAVCPHGGGPPRCWCRPPLPGLPLVFARKHDVDPARSILVGTSTAHRTLANTLGARYVAGA
jgi:adenylate kinase family enzyme